MLGVSGMESSGARACFMGCSSSDLSEFTQQQQLFLPCAANDLLLLSLTQIYGKNFLRALELLDSGHRVVQYKAEVSHRSAVTVCSSCLPGWLPSMSALVAVHSLPGHAAVLLGTGARLQGANRCLPGFSQPLLLV